MSTDVTPAQPPKALKWIGWVLSILPIPLFAMSAFTKLRPPEGFLEQFAAKSGMDANVMGPLGAVELVCVILYAIPQTCVLGAILLTGYLGGAIATHVHMRDSFIMPAAIGVVLWLGILLRDARLRQLLPIRR